MTDESLKRAEAPRPRRRRKADRPGEIIEAGLVEFGSAGFGAARMEDVARRAGVAKGTVFRYFATKEALFEAALASRAAPVFDGLHALLEQHEGPMIGFVGLMLDRIYDDIGRPELSALMRVIITEGARFPAILAVYHRMVIAQGQAVLSQLVARGIATGEFRQGAVAELPMVLFAPALMAAVWQMTFNAVQPVGLDRFRAVHLDMAMGALLPRRGDPPS